MTVYEARDSLITRLDENYPIGLNPRGVKALDQANRDLAIDIRTKGFMVDGWRIFAGIYWQSLPDTNAHIYKIIHNPWSLPTYQGKRQVAEVQSGLVIGTTRSIINQTVGR